MRRGLGVAVLLLAVLAGCDGTADDTAAAGNTDGPGAEPDSSLPDSPFGEVLAWSVSPAEGTVWAVTSAEETCASCAALWAYEHQVSGKWRRVHTFAEPEEPGRDDGAGPFPPVSATSLVMSPNGAHGWFRWDTDGILATDNAGASWTWLPAPDDATEAAQGELAVHDEHLYLVATTDCDSGECPTRVWRTAVGEADWTEVTPEGADGIFALHTTSAGLWAEDLGTGDIFTSGTGEQWQRTPNSRYGDLCLPAPGSPSLQVATCETNDQGRPGGEVQVSDDRGRTWRTVHETARHLDTVAPGPDGQLAVGTDRATYLVSEGVRVELPRSVRRAGEWRVEFVGEQAIYASGGHRLHVSRDGGRSWEDLTGRTRTR